MDCAIQRAPILYDPLFFFLTDFLANQLSHSHGLPPSRHNAATFSAYSLIITYTSSSFLYPQISEAKSDTLSHTFILCIYGWFLGFLPQLANYIHSVLLVCMHFTSLSLRAALFPSFLEIPNQPASISLAHQTDHWFESKICHTPSMWFSKSTHLRSSIWLLIIWAQYFPNSKGWNFFF